MIVDGKAIADEILNQTRREAERLSRTPSFAAVTVAPTPSTESYLKIKRRLAERAGIAMEVVAPDAQTTEELIATIAADTHDALIVQLPLPEHLDMQAVLAAIPPEKDADVLSPATRAAGTLMHPIAAAIADIFHRNGVDPSGKRAVVVGSGWLVGQPVSAWLKAAGADVTVVTRESGDITDICRAADIIVSGAGSPGLITAQMVADGAVVIDVGTSELAGGIAGDVAPAVADLASVFTPVPGGVGPVAVACLMQNVVELARLRQSS